MAAKGYCTADDVADLLGQTFTAAQETHCDNLIEQAEITIDEKTNRGWLVGAQTDEAFYRPGYRMFVRYAPLTSVDAITGRAGLGQAEETLTVDEDYEVRDLESGLIYLVYPTRYDRVLADYTPVNATPLDIKRACIELVAAWMQPHLQPGAFGLDSYSLPDLTVRFARSYVQMPLPPAVQETLEHYRYRVHA
jgi:hypothetical protein